MADSIPPWNALDLQASAISFALVLARVLGLLWPLTSWGIAALDPRVRLLLALTGAGLLTPTLGPLASSAVSSDAGLVGLALLGLGELARGLGLGVSAALLVAAARQGGELIGLAAGLSPQIDPGPPTGLTASAAGPDEPLTPSGALFTGLALFAFLALDGPLLILLALADTYRAFPSSEPLGVSSPALWSALSSDLLGTLADGIGRAMALSLRLAAPFVLPLILAQIVLLLLTRAGPAAPWASVSWPLRIVLGIVLIGLGLSWLFQVLQQSWNLLLGSS